MERRTESYSREVGGRLCTSSWARSARSAVDSGGEKGLERSL